MTRLRTAPNWQSLRTLPVTDAIQHNVQHNHLRMNSYRPPIFLRNGHLQTLMVGIVCGYRPAYNARRIECPIDDTQSLVVHEELGCSLPAVAPIAILIHGLGGDHRSPYLQRLADRLQNQGGVRAWRVDLRGSGAGVNLAWQPAHAGASQDLAVVVARAQEIYPQAPIRLAGFSLSGNIVLKFLAELAAGRYDIAPENVQRAVAIAPPVDLHACADNMDRFSRRIYTRYYLKMLAKQVEERSKLWEQWQRLPKKPLVRSIRQFDSRFTAPLNQFRDADHYYTDSSSLALLPNITTPTMILADKHDPIVEYKSLAEAELNPQTQLITTYHGGHMGYFMRSPQGQLYRWMEDWAFQVLTRVD